MYKQTNLGPMNTNEIANNNRLIAEFMDLNVLLEGYEHKYTLTAVVEGPNGHKVVKYNESWDWLMPVFHKIQDVSKPLIYIELFECKLKVLFNNMSFLYEAIIDFILWYNENK